jgi:hypothetical protein
VRTSDAINTMYIKNCEQKTFQNNLSSAVKKENRMRVTEKTCYVAHQGLKQRKRDGQINEELHTYGAEPFLRSR